MEEWKNINKEYEISNLGRIRRTKNNGTNTATANGNNTTNSSLSGDTSYDRNRTVTGLNGKSYIELFKQYSEAMKNIDMEVIAELAPCFMSVF